jgi:hypothetical protein
MNFRSGMLSLVFVASAATSTLAHAEWRQLTGKGYVICDAINRRLNTFQWTSESASEEYGFYVWSVVASYAGWKQPPWQDLDVANHLELIRRLTHYQTLGADAYFGRKEPSAFSARRMVDVDQRTDDAIKKGAQLRIWHAHLVSFDGNAHSLADPPLQPLAQLTPVSQNEEMQRLKKLRPNWPIAPRLSGTVVLTDDSMGPDPRVDDRVSSILSVAPVLLFGGEAHFVTVYTDGHTVGIDRDFGIGPVSFLRNSVSVPRVWEVRKAANHGTQLDTGYELRRFPLESSRNSRGA